MALCGSYQCGCGLSVSSDLTLSGSGESADPFVIGLAEAPVDTPRISLVRTTAMSISSGGGGTTITWGTSEANVVEEPTTFKAAADDIITIPVGYAGDYMLTFGGVFALNTTGVRQIWVTIGANTAYPDELTDVLQTALATSTLANTITGGKLVRLDAGATLTMKAYQNSGGALNLTNMFITLHRVAPVA